MHALQIETHVKKQVKNKDAFTFRLLFKYKASC